MSYLLVVDKIQRSGGSIWAEDGYLRIEVLPGLLTAEDRAVLAYHKRELLPLLTRPIPVEDKEEREAIIWCETAPSEEVDRALDQAITEFREIVRASRLVVPPDPELGRGTRDILASVGVTVTLNGDDLRFAGDPDVIEAANRDGLLDRYRGAIRAALLDQEIEFVGGIDEWIDENTVEPAACDTCGSLERWRDLAGDWHCQLCRPPVRANKARKAVAAIRNRQRGRLEAK